MKGQAAWQSVPFCPYSAHVCAHPTKAYGTPPARASIKGTQGLTGHRPAVRRFQLSRELAGRQFGSTVTEHRPCLGQPFLSITFQNLLKKVQHVPHAIHRDDPFSCQGSGIKSSTARGPAAAPGMSRLQRCCFTKNCKDSWD